MSGLVYMVDRLLNVPMEQDKFDKEVCCIKSIASNNGYPESLVQKLIDRRFKKKMDKELEENGVDSCRKKDRGFPVSIPFLGPLSVKIGEKLGRMGVSTAFKSKYSLKALLPRAKDHVEPLDRSGVYRISCTTCDATYVGQCGRKIKSRLKEHVTRENSEFYQHTLREGHDKSAIKYELLHEAKKGKKMTIAEGLHIKLDKLKSGPRNINKQGDIVNLRYVTDASLVALQGQGLSHKATLLETTRL